MLDGLMDPVTIAISVELTGQVERQGSHDRVSSFLKALDQWLLETDQPVRVDLSASVVGTPER